MSGPGGTGVDSHHNVAATARRFSGAQASSSAASSTAIVARAAGDGAAAGGVRRFVRQQVPDDVLHDAALNEAIKVLPANYNFEIHKTVWRLRQANAKTVALQFPEGLLMYACIIADILEAHAGVEHTLVMGDVTYGACCIDDFSAAALAADFLVHYGHSCLVPVDVTSVPCLYVFVDISVDVEHFVECVRLNFKAGAKLVVAGTIQFSSAIQLAKQRLAGDFPSLAVPKCKPLSPGEVLGCTAPVLAPGDAEAILFLADGRFHLEAIMIANPSIPAYRYDPYGRILTRERYDHAGMRTARRRAVEAAMAAAAATSAAGRPLVAEETACGPQGSPRASVPDATKTSAHVGSSSSSQMSKGGGRWALVLGTLGRQGNPAILATLERLLSQQGLSYTVLLMSEVTPPRVAMLAEAIGVFVQIACPRLSIDWGEGFARPTLTPYEAMVALGAVPPWWTAGQTAPAAAAAGAAAAAPGAPRPEPEESAHGPCSGGARVLAQAGDDDDVEALAPYPMDYYAKEGGVWNSSYHKR